MSIAKALLVGLLAVGALALTAAIASAQYPVQIGGVSASASTVSAPVGSTLTITCNSRSPSGAALAGDYMTVIIISNPGNASLSQNLGLTDANGNFSVTLNVGTSNGEIHIWCDSEGRTSRVIVQVVDLPTSALSDLIGGDGFFALSGDTAGLFRTAGLASLMPLTLVAFVGFIRSRRNS